MFEFLYRRKVWPKLARWMGSNQTQMTAISVSGEGYMWEQMVIESMSGGTTESYMHQGICITVQCHANCIKCVRHETSVTCYMIPMEFKQRREKRTWKQLEKCLFTWVNLFTVITPIWLSSCNPSKRWYVVAITLSPTHDKDHSIRTEQQSMEPINSDDVF